MYNNTTDYLNPKPNSIPNPTPNLNPINPAMLYTDRSEIQKLKQYLPFQLICGDLRCLSRPSSSSSSSSSSINNNSKILTFQEISIIDTWENGKHAQNSAVILKTLLTI